MFYQNLMYVKNLNIKVFICYDEPDKKPRTCSLLENIKANHLRQIPLSIEL